MPAIRTGLIKAWADREHWPLPLRRRLAEFDIERATRFIGVALWERWEAEREAREREGAPAPPRVTESRRALFHDCTRVLELTEQVAAGLLITVRQAVWLRCRLSSAALPSAGLQGMIDALSADIAVIEEDRRLEPDLRLLLERIHGRAWKIYE